jgi:hypothetical protein
MVRHALQGLGGWGTAAEHLGTDCADPGFSDSLIKHPAMSVLIDVVKKHDTFTRIFFVAFHRHCDQREAIQQRAPA